jgi:hypothetical protein
MATQPGEPAPDTIEPQSPPEAPVEPTPVEAPEDEPPGIYPPEPDITEPGRGPSEIPPPPD